MADASAPTRARYEPPGADRAAWVLDQMPFAEALLFLDDHSDSTWTAEALRAKESDPVDRGLFWVARGRDWIWPVRVVILQSLGVRRAIFLTYDTVLAEYVVRAQRSDRLDESLGGESGRARALSIPAESGPARRA